MMMFGTGDDRTVKWDYQNGIPFVEKHSLAMLEMQW